MQGSVIKAIKEKYQELYDRQPAAHTYERGFEAGLKWVLDLLTKEESSSVCCDNCLSKVLAEELFWHDGELLCPECVDKLLVIR